MPTKHARLALTLDPELEAAIERGARVLGRNKPRSALVREMVLRAADVVAEEQSDLDRWLDGRGGVVPATLSWDEALMRAEELRKDVPPGRPLSEILDELREDRI